MTTSWVLISGVDTPVPEGAIAWINSTCLEEGRWLYSEDVDLMREVMRDDGRLIVEVPGALCRRPWCDRLACGCGYCEAHDDDRLDMLSDLSRGGYD